MYPLAFAKEGETVIVKSINAGFGVIQRLSSMGLNIGSKLKVIRNQNGPVIVSVRGCNIAVGKGLAMKIIVERV
ncbi:ferrous iron transport protein A [Methanocaldococcus sp.]|uniref:FeoA family protein n=1 Tax=Methanocaldococcus sp. TaxID=2152917 RepID=UPI002634104D|nr:ferrous iron transport protein A [Methanocaldococcus sp.]MCQ6253698.1 ferrous iron transport protein A [Methanocaldococcus sp.]